MGICQSSTFTYEESSASSSIRKSTSAAIQPLNEKYPLPQTQVQRRSVSQVPELPLIKVNSYPIQKGNGLFHLHENLHSSTENMSPTSGTGSELPIPNTIPSLVISISTDRSGTHSAEGTDRKHFTGVQSPSHHYQPQTQLCLSPSLGSTSLKDISIQTTVTHPPVSSTHIKPKKQSLIRGRSFSNLYITKTVESGKEEKMETVFNQVKTQHPQPEETSPRKSMFHPFLSFRKSSASPTPYLYHSHTVPTTPFPVSVHSIPHESSSSSTIPSFPLHKSPISQTVMIPSSREDDKDGDTYTPVILFAQVFTLRPREDLFDQEEKSYKQDGESSLLPSSTRSEIEVRHDKRLTRCILYWQKIQLKIDLSTPYFNMDWCSATTRTNRRSFFIGLCHTSKKFLWAFPCVNTCVPWFTINQTFQYILTVVIHGGPLYIYRLPRVKKISYTPRTRFKWSDVTMTVINPSGKSEGESVLFTHEFWYYLHYKGTNISFSPKRDTDTPCAMIEELHAYKDLMHFQHNKHDSSDAETEPSANPRPSSNKLRRMSSESMIPLVYFTFIRRFLFMEDEDATFYQYIYGHIPEMKTECPIYNKESKPSRSSFSEPYLPKLIQETRTHNNQQFVQPDSSTIQNLINSKKKFY